MQRVCVIIPAAGKGRRMRSSVAKPFIKIGNRELICHTIAVFEKSRPVSDIIIAAAMPDVERIIKLIKKYRFSKVRSVISGGPTRAQSVLNAMKKVSNDTDYVLVHDMARPFVTVKLIEDVLRQAKRYGAALAAVRVKSTIKESLRERDFVCATPDRRFLWEAQTPQAFKRSVIFNAYRKAKRLSRFTDDASVVESAGARIKLVNGDYNNIKLTTPEDVAIAKAIVKIQN